MFQAKAQAEAEASILVTIVRLTILENTNYGRLLVVNGQVILITIFDIMA